MHRLGKLHEHLAVSLEQGVTYTCVPYIHGLKTNGNGGLNGSNLDLMLCNR